MTMERPPSINHAVLAMRIGALISALYLVITLAMLGSLKDDIRDELDRQNETYTQSDIDTTFGIIITSVVVFGVIGVILWLWMAAKNRQGPQLGPHHGNRPRRAEHPAVAAQLCRRQLAGQPDHRRPALHGRQPGGRGGGAVLHVSQGRERVLRRDVSSLTAVAARVGHEFRPAPQWHP